jgi:hypothetical protein
MKPLRTARDPEFPLAVVPSKVKAARCASNPLLMARRVNRA